jgi:dihydroorotase
MTGERVANLDLSAAWLVDPAGGREGPADVVVEDGVVRSVAWLTGAAAGGADDRGLVVAPGFTDLHAHLREPGDEDAETIATGLAAAAHGGFTTVCAMPDTTPPMDEPAVVARVRAAAAASGSPVRLLAFGALSAGRAGEQLALLGELAEEGVVGYTDDGAVLKSSGLLRNALVYAGMLGLPVVQHALDPGLSSGAEAAEGLVATVLGLKGSPAAAEAAVVARDIAILRDVRRDVPGARIHFAHLSTAGALEVVRAAKAAGLPVTCDVAPHHLALSEEWIAGARRWAWEAIGDDGSIGNPWRDGALVAGPYASELRVDPPLRPVEDALACLAALADGTADAVATDHSPRNPVDRDLEFAVAPPGIPGLETAIGVLLAAVDAGRLTLGRAIAALTTGPAGVLGRSASGSEAAVSAAPAVRPRRAPGIVVGEPADLVVIDRSSPWEVRPEDLLSRDRRSALVGRTLPGRVLLTVADGRVAWEAPEA